MALSQTPPSTPPPASPPGSAPHAPALPGSPDVRPMDPNARVRLLLSELERLRAAYGERLSAAERSALGAVLGDLVGAVGGPGSALRHRDDAQADRDAGLEDDAHGAPGHASADRPSDEPDRRHGHGRSDDGVAEASDHFSAEDDPNAGLIDRLNDDLGQGEGWIPSRDPDAPYAAEAAQIRAAIDGGPEDRRRLAAGANLCPAAVGALFASKDIAALRILAANTEAHLSAPAVARLARWAKIDPDLAAAFIDRPDLTPALLTQLFFDLRSRLRRRILARARSVRLPQEEIEPIFSAPAPDAQPQSPTARRSIRLASARSTGAILTADGDRKTYAIKICRFWSGSDAAMNSCVGSPPAPRSANRWRPRSSPTRPGDPPLWRAAPRRWSRAISPRWWRPSKRTRRSGAASTPPRTTQPRAPRR